MFLFPEGHCLNEIHDPGSGLQPRNSGLNHTYAQPFLTSNGTWPTSLALLSAAADYSRCHSDLAL